MRMHTEKQTFTGKNKKRYKNGSKVYGHFTDVLQRRGYVFYISPLK